jgi:hypothetical protein
MFCFVFFAANLCKIYSLQLLPHIGSLSDLGVQDANRKARKLMFKLISITNVIPKSLFIFGVKTETHLVATMISMGGYGRVFRGELKGQQVALKVVDQGVHDVSALSGFLLDDIHLFDKDSLSKDFCREAITWRSLSHRFILPLLGIFEENSQLILVSPFMENGTLTRWRSKQKRDVIEIHRLVRLLCLSVWN